MTTVLNGRFLATFTASVTSVGAYGASAADLGPFGVGLLTPPPHRDMFVVGFEGFVSTPELYDDGSIYDKLGDNQDAYAAIFLRKQYAPDRDWQLGAAYHFGQSQTFDISGDTGGSGTFDFSSDSGFNFQTIDFDVGKHVNRGPTDVRLFGGVRAIHVGEHFDLSYDIVPDDPLNDKTATLDKLGAADFWGIGPRGGVQVVHPITASWGVTGSVSVAAMFGSRHVSVSYVGTSEDPPDPVDNIDVQYDRWETETLGNFNAAAGLQWMPTDRTTLTIGYQVDYWTNLRFTSGSTEEWFHGPFLRLEVKG